MRVCYFDFGSSAATDLVPLVMPEGNPIGSGHTAGLLCPLIGFQQQWVARTDSLV
jgi:hypothetical protein